MYVKHRMSPLTISAIPLLQRFSTAWYSSSEATAAYRALSVSVVDPDKDPTRSDIICIRGAGSENNIGSGFCSSAKLIVKMIL